MAKLAERAFGPADSGLAFTRALRKLFTEAHAESMAALGRKDYAAVEAAVRRKSEIIQAQMVLMQDERAALDERLQRLRTERPNNTSKRE